MFLEKIEITIIKNGKKKNAVYDFEDINFNTEHSEKLKGIGAFVENYPIHFANKKSNTDKTQTKLLFTSD